MTSPVTKLGEVGSSLLIDNRPHALSADYSLRFVNVPGQPAKPVLYFQGRRVVTSWKLIFSHEEPADPWGCSG